MFTTSRFLVFPDGETQEVEQALEFDALVDLNGKRLRPPLPTEKMIAYRVSKIVKKEQKGEDIYFYHLNLVSARELMGWVAR